MPVAKTEQIWHNGKFIHWDDAKIHVLAHVIHYGSAVFEGIRCYESAQGPAIFRLRDHMQRLLHSGHIYRMDTRFSLDELCNAAVELVRVNKMTACYIRPITLRGYGEVGVDPRGCPSDAANWDSTAFSPETHLYYVMTLEECTGKPTSYPDQTGQRFLRALNIETGEIVWEVPQPGAARAKTWSGVLATAGGLIFYGRPNGGFAAVDQRNGKTLWQFPTNVRMKGSPMTFTLGGNQYVAVAAGPNILCFGL